MQKFINIRIGLLALLAANFLLTGCEPPKPKLKYMSDYAASEGWTIKGWFYPGSSETTDCNRVRSMAASGQMVSATKNKSGATISQHHISQYLGSCERFYKTMLNNSVLPKVKLWCTHRSEHPRYETTCTEWEQHGAEYIRANEENAISARAACERRFGTGICNS